MNDRGWEAYGADELGEHVGELVADMIRAKLDAVLPTIESATTNRDQLRAEVVAIRAELRELKVRSEAIL